MFRRKPKLFSTVAEYKTSVLQCSNMHTIFNRFIKKTPVGLLQSWTWQAGYQVSHVRVYRGTEILRTLLAGPKSYREAEKTKLCYKWHCPVLVETISVTDVKHIKTLE